MTKWINLVYLSRSILLLFMLRANGCLSIRIRLRVCKQKETGTKESLVVVSIYVAY